MRRLKMNNTVRALVVSRGSYWEMKIRGKYDIDVYEDDPEYTAWTLGFRLARNTQGDADAQEG